MWALRWSYSAMYVSSYSIYVSSYYYICVLILLYVSSYYHIYVLILLYVSSYYYICVLILLYMCPHARRVRGESRRSSYYTHTTIYVSSYYYICVLILGGSGVSHDDRVVAAHRPGTHFTCFTGTKVQMLTPAEQLIELLPRTARLLLSTPGPTVCHYEYKAVFFLRKKSD